MSWKNYGWVFEIRGVEPYERNVLMYIADEADASGYIDAFRLSRLSENSETPRRRLLQILKRLEEEKGFIERVQRVWDKRLKQPKYVPKGEKKTGRQIATGYRLCKQRFFPKTKIDGKLVNDAAIWLEIKTALRSTKQFADGVFRIYLDGVVQSYYVRRTQTLCLLAGSPTHQDWLKKEAVKVILEVASDLRPSVKAVIIFALPTPIG